MARALIHVPPSPKKGEVIEIRTTIGHPMETGLRVDADGRKVPQDIIRRFTCTYNGEPLFECDLFIAIAANPFIAFHAVATESGTLRFSWQGDNGFSHTEVVAITVA